MTVNTKLLKELEKNQNELAKLDAKYLIGEWNMPSISHEEYIKRRHRLKLKYLKLLGNA